MLVPNIVIPFDSLESLIPSGFERDTRFDGRFPKGASSGLGDTGGATTHSHTYSHSHTVASHTHSANSGSSRDRRWSYATNENTGNATVGHSHTGGSTGTSGSQASGTTNVTFNTTSNNPPYYEVLFIKSNGTNLIPTNGMVYTTGDREGMTYHTESENRFLKGAASGLDQAGTGGSSTHTHSQSHTHTPTSHSHATGTISGYSGNQAEGGVSAAEIDGTGHTHTFTVNSASQDMKSNTTSSGSASTEPLHTTMKHYKATQPSVPLPGDIAMTTEATTPVGWKDCDGTNGTPNLVGYYLKNTQTAEQTAGSNTHNHSFSHSHQGNTTHTHTIANSGLSAYSDAGNDGINNSSPDLDSIGEHRHEVFIAATKANYNTTSGNTSTDNSEPEYIQVKFIQFEFSTVGGSFLFNLL